MKILLKKIGREIRKRRMKQGWTLETLATKSGISMNLLKGIESGEKDYRIDILMQLAKTLKTTAHKILKDAAD